jgi:hypothetical protein
MSCNTCTSAYLLIGGTCVNAGNCVTMNMSTGICSAC